LVILALLCGTVSQGHAQDPRARASLVIKSKEQFVSRGLNHPRSDVDIGQVEGIINAPVGHVIQLLRDYANYRHFLPFFTGSKVIVRDDRGALVRMKAKILKGAVTIDAVVRASEKAVGYGGTRFELHKVKGNIDLLDAVWTVYPIAGDRTLVIFRMMLDPDIWFVRDSTLSNYNQVNSRRTIRSIRDRVKKVPYQPPRPQAVAPEQVPPTPQMPPAAPGPAPP
jgi:ribosome-associated toxin RatA of RatAB toxin-antitoxin module